MKPLSLQTPVKDLFMVGPTYAKRLQKLNIKTAEDFLHHYPFRYDDFRLTSKIDKLQVGEIVTIVGKIVSFENIYTRFGKKIQKMKVADETGQLQVTFFNQPFLKTSLKPGLLVSLSGKVETAGGHLSLVSPQYEIIKTPIKSTRHPELVSGSIDKKMLKQVQHDTYQTIHTGRLVPVYPETYGVSSKWLRSRLAPLLSELLIKTPDWLPVAIKKTNNLIDLPKALTQIHFPQNEKDIETAKQRLAFDELFLIQLQTLLRKHRWQKNKTTHPLKVNQEDILRFIANLPFTLTTDQNRSIKDILSDLSQTRPMNRLLQGDVGCGKTVVAAVAAYVAWQNGVQTAMMAPTEILAIQHYQTIKTLLESFGINIGLATSSKKINCQSKTKKTWDIIIGTHALLYNKIDFQNLGLVIIDEQHRFGVEQRGLLVGRGKAPHTLVMTATPIPRTVALTLYGDLDLSTIKQMPQGRKLIKTWVVPGSKRLAAYGWIKKQILTGDQAFIVCPLIDESEKESMKNIKAAKDEFKNLSQKIFPDLKLGLLHGRMKSGEKEKVITAFKQKKLDILVATPVVEVGIDIPTATIIVIEAAERFGLAALHQLRGRVGRGDKQAYCLLFSSQEAVNFKRLKIMETVYNGLTLAEMDLKLRGPGELYGTAQHGFLQLKIARFSDLALVQKTRQAGSLLLQKSHYTLTNFPLLKGKLEKYTIKTIEPN
jgi:ATP-dependent DNA helicase RecG